MEFQAKASQTLLDSYFTIDNITLSVLYGLLKPSLFAASLTDEALECKGLLCSLSAKHRCLKAINSTFSVPTHQILMLSQWPVFDTDRLRKFKELESPCVGELGQTNTGLLFRCSCPMWNPKSILIFNFDYFHNLFLTFLFPKSYQVYFEETCI